MTSQPKKKPKDLHAEGGTVPLLGQTDIPHSRIELMLSARNLMDKDVISKSDPICVVYCMTHKGQAEIETYMEIGRTEIIYNNLNPQWNTKIQMDYFFESKQQLRFEIYDIDNNKTNNLARQDFLGSCECHLADIVTATDGALVMKLGGKGIIGELVVHAEEVDKGQKEIVHLVVRGQKLAKPGFFSCCCFTIDPFLEIYRVYSNGGRQMVKRTEVQHNMLDPEWKPIEISVRHLCEGDKDRKFQIKCFNYKLGGKHALLGTANLTVNQLTSKKIRIQALSESKSGGSLHFLRAECCREYTWLDFVRGGMQLEFAVSIDFTASNGNPTQPGTRHFIDQFCLNQYELAIKSVLEICEHYNSTKIFEAFGFGAKIPPNDEASHLFPLDVDTWQPNVTGVKGVMDAYRSSLHRVQLFGPTNFEPTIRQMLSKCRTFPRDGSRYQILLIITDGLITDMGQTKTAIIEASDQPLSIIIIGVGDEDFSKMNELDSDEVMLSHRNVYAHRDIVQVSHRDVVQVLYIFCLLIKILIL